MDDLHLALFYLQIITSENKQRYIPLADVNNIKLHPVFLRNALNYTINRELYFYSSNCNDELTD